MLKSIINSALKISLGHAITVGNHGDSTLDLAQMLETSVTTEPLALAQSSRMDLIKSHGINWIKAEDHVLDGIWECVAEIEMPHLNPTGLFL